MSELGWGQVIGSAFMLAMVILVVAVVMGKLLRENREHMEKMTLMEKCTRTIQSPDFSFRSQDHAHRYMAAFVEEDFEKALRILEETDG